MTDPILFAFAVIAILATPGPTNALLATAGAANGLRRSLPLVPAELAGYVIAIAAGGGGQAIASRTSVGKARGTTAFPSRTVHFGTSVSQE